MAPAGELVRVVRTGDGMLAAGRTLPGRGAWLCAASDACLEQAERRKGFPRAFRAPVQGGAVAALRAQLRERARIGDCDFRS